MTATNGGPQIDATRVIADLRELERRTGGATGARRVAWGEQWRAARAFLQELLGEIGLRAEPDAAGNLWAVLAGERRPALAQGSLRPPRRSRSSGRPPVAARRRPARSSSGRES